MPNGLRSMWGLISQIFLNDELKDKYRKFSFISIALLAIYFIYQFHFILSPSTPSEIEVLDYKKIDKNKLTISYKILDLQKQKQQKTVTNTYRVDSLCVKEVNYYLLNIKGNRIIKSIKKDILGVYRIFVDSSHSHVIVNLVFINFFIFLVISLNIKLFAVKLIIAWFNITINMIFFSIFWSAFFPEQSILTSKITTMNEHSVHDVEDSFLFKSIEFLNKQGNTQKIFMLAPLTTTDVTTLTIGTILLHNENKLNYFFLLQSPYFVFLSLSLVNFSAGIFLYIFLSRFNDKIMSLFEVARAWGSVRQTSR